MAKNGALQLLQARAGLDTEFLAEGSPSAPVGLERLDLTVVSVEGQHQLCAQALSVGVRSHQGFKLGNKCVLATECEIRLDPALDRGQAELLEAPDLALGKALEREIRECGPPPECERSTKRHGRGCGVTARELLPTRFEESLEAVRVEPLRRNMQHVPRRLGEQGLLTVSGGEQTPQPCEIDVEDRVDRLRRPVGPELLDQSFARDGLVRVQQQKAEERALPRTADREWALSPDDLKRSEDAELEIRTRRRWSMVRPSSLRMGASPDRLLDLCLAFRCRFSGG